MKIIRHIAICSICLAIISCAGWRTMTGIEKAKAIAAYYQTFVAGVKAAIPLLRTYYPGSASVIDGPLMTMLSNADTVMSLYQHSIELYEVGSADWSQILTHQNEIYAIIQDINALVASIRGETEARLEEGNGNYAGQVDDHICCSISSQRSS